MITQTKALETLDQIAQEFATLAGHYWSPASGDVAQGWQARALAGLQRQRAEVFDQLVKLASSGRNPTGTSARLQAMTARGAAANARHLAKTWETTALRHEETAADIAEKARAAFADDGMTYVPGRGRIRATSPVTGESNDASPGSEK
jgi:hypothetical protein